MEFPDTVNETRILTAEESIRSTKTIDEFDYIYGNITNTKKLDLDRINFSLLRILELQKGQEDKEKNNIVESKEELFPSSSFNDVRQTVAPIKRKHRKKKDLKFPDLIKGSTK